MYEKVFFRVSNTPDDNQICRFVKHVKYTIDRRKVIIFIFMKLLFAMLTHQTAHIKNFEECDQYQFLEKINFAQNVTHFDTDWNALIAFTYLLSKC